MNDKSDHAFSHLFTIRVWLEGMGEGQSEWRGQVRYVLTGETYYFRQWDQLRETFQRCLPEFDLTPDGRPDSLDQVRGVVDHE